MAFNPPVPKNKPRKWCVQINYNTTRGEKYKPYTSQRLYVLGKYAKDEYEHISKIYQDNDNVLVCLWELNNDTWTLISRNRDN